MFSEHVFLRTPLEGCFCMLHDNVNSKRHLSKSKLHFSNYGSGVSVESLKEFLNRFTSLTSVKAIEAVHNSFITNKDIDNSFSNDLVWNSQAKN